MKAHQQIKEIIASVRSAVADGALETERRLNREAGEIQREIVRLADYLGISEDARIGDAWSPKLSDVRTSSTMGGWLFELGKTRDALQRLADKKRAEESEDIEVAQEVRTLAKQYRALVKDAVKVHAFYEGDKYAERLKAQKSLQRKVNKLYLATMDAWSNVSFGGYVDILIEELLNKRGLREFHESLEYWTDNSLNSFEIRANAYADRLDEIATEIER